MAKEGDWIESIRIQYDDEGLKRGLSGEKGVYKKERDCLTCELSGKARFFCFIYV
jgi:hypothetical protein